MVGTSRTSEKGMLIARCPESAGPDHRDVACQSRASCAKLQGSGDLVLLFAGFVSDGGIDENDDDVDALLVNMGYFKICHKATQSQTALGEICARGTDYGFGVALNFTGTFLLTDFSASNETFAPLFVLNFTSVGCLTFFLARKLTVCFFGAMGLSLRRLVGTGIKPIPTDSRLPAPRSRTQLMTLQFEHSFSASRLFGA
jgi:hypothetical protein